MASVSEATIKAIDANGREHAARVVWDWEADATRPRVAVYRVQCHVDGYSAFIGSAADYFAALREVRLSMERAGLRLCCAGARRDTWASGTQRDMGQGLRCYVLSTPRTAHRPSDLGIFDEASPELVGTVAEQEASFNAWAASPRA